ncbi:MAG: TonB-dependent receptor [Ignavibacteriales bacterium]|nr:MAG: TonB-dependent receptor [Ignavibacteriales bacterium]
MTVKFLTVIFFQLTFFSLTASQTQSDSFDINERNVSVLSDSVVPYQLKEVEIISTKYKAQIEDLSIPVEVSDKKELFISSGVTPSDILNKEAGLSSSRDGIWGTFITIRGLNKNNIVSLVDGNRIETANDIAAGLSLIEVNDINRIEVLKSASSSLYGSGALGGVVNIITEKGFYPEVLRLNVSAISSFSSVNNNGSGTLSFNFGNNSWFINLRGTLRSAGDTATPDGILKNSQFRNKNYSFFAGYKTQNKQELKISHQNYLAEDVGIPGNTLFTPYAEVRYLKAERKLSSLEYSFENPFYTLIKLQAKLFYHTIEREVENKPYVISYSNNRTIKTSIHKINPNGNHRTIGASLQSDWLFGNNFVIAGIEVWQRTLITDRERQLLVETIDTNSMNVVNSVQKIIGEKPIPDSKYLSAGFFLQNESEIIKDKLKLTLGGRIDRIQIQNDKVYSPLYEITNGVYNHNPVDKKLIWQSENAADISWSSNISFLYTLFEDVDLTFAAARSFRSPSLEERYQYIDQSGFVRIGNPELEPEKGYFFDSGLRIRKNNFTFSGNLFLNLLNDLVSEEPGTFEGRPAYFKTNIGKARLYGFDLSIQYNFYRSYSFSGVLSFVNGKDTENKTFLPQIPPLNGRIIFSFIPIDYFQIGLSATFFTNQNKTAPQELETPGYVIYDFYLLSAPFNFGFIKIQTASGIDNIMNKSYRNHLTSFRGLILSEPARNYFIKVKVDL